MINQKRAGVIVSYLSEGVKILSSLIYTPIMLRLLGQSEYGLYQLVYSVVSYLGLLSLGFTSAYVRFYSRYRAAHDDTGEYRLNGMYLILFSIIAVISLFCGFVMVNHIELIFKTGLTVDEYATARILMSLMVINLAISFPNSIFVCIVNAHERFLFQRVLTLLSNILNPFLSIPVLLLGYGSIGLVIVTTLITVASFITNIYYCFNRIHTKFVFSGFDFSLFKEIGAFTFYIFLNQIIDQINWSLDKFLLGRLINSAAVAIYSLGAQINTLYVHLSASVSNVFVPQVNRIVSETDDNSELTRVFIKVGRIQFIILFLILSGFIWFGYQFMILWGGSLDYSASYVVSLFLMVPVTVPLIQNIGIEIQRAKNMHKARSVVYFFIAISNVFVSIPLVRNYGPIGASIGTAISLFLGNVVFMNWYYKHRIGLDVKSFWISILSFSKALIIPLMFGFVINRAFVITSYLELLLLATLYSIIYCYSMWKFGLNAFEKEQVFTIVRRLKMIRR